MLSWRARSSSGKVWLFSCPCVRRLRVPRAPRRPPSSNAGNGDHPVADLPPATADLGRILSAPCATHEQIDDALRGWLYLASAFREQFHDSDTDVLHCAQQLLYRPIFAENRDYVRTQIVFSLLQEDEVAPLHVIASFLLADGRADDDGAFGRMIEEGCVARLLELLGSPRHEEYRLHRVLLELTYEMCRMERMRMVDLMHVDDAFVCHLLHLVEVGSGDASDPYQYPVIRVLVRPNGLPRPMAAIWQQLTVSSSY